jgi:DNA modification methylase
METTLNHGHKVTGDEDWLSYLCAAAPIYNGRRAQLPAEVAEWAVAPFAIPGGNFLDPFAGSGALVNAAERHGMNALGFEIQER